MLRGRSAVLAARMVHVDRVGRVGGGVGGGRSLAAITGGVHGGAGTQSPAPFRWQPNLLTQPII